MNYAQLRAFHAVASAGGFSRAAAALNVTQPTLSGQVKELEAAYGVRLFDRRGRRSEPTELGRELLAITRRYFTLESEAEQLLAATRGLRRGHLRVGADAPYHVMAALAAFNRKYQGVRMSLSIGNSQELLRDLLEHRCDVAVLADVPVDERLHTRLLRRDRLIAFVPRDHPWAKRRRVRPRDFGQARMILREPGSTTRRLFEAAMAKAGVTLSESLEIGSREAVREAVAAGLGVGVVSASEFAGDPRLKSLSIDGPAIDSSEHVVCLAERRELLMVRAFLEVIEPAKPAVSGGARPGRGG